MKVLGWILTVIWALTSISLLAEVINGIDVETNLMAIALVGTQIYFNYFFLKGLK